MSTTPLEYYGTGKRKTSIARVHLRPGKGEFQLNDRGLDEYFGGIEALKQVVKQPFSATETNDHFDVVATIDGGGVVAQASAIRHGISRALCVFNAELRGQAEEGGLPDARRAHQGAQEVRAEGRPSPVPVQQALNTSPARGRKARGAISRSRAAKEAVLSETTVPTRCRTRDDGSRRERQHQGPARSGRPLRAPDPPLGPEDEGVHLRRAQRDLHHRPAEDPQAAAGRPRSSCRTRRRRARR